MWIDLRTEAREAFRAVSEGLRAPRPRPGELVRTAQARVRTVLNSARSLSSSGATTDTLRKELRRITDEVVDVEHMARGALWDHWAHRTVAERQEYIALFTDLLERLYVVHLRQSQWVTVMPVHEMVQETFATVTWKIGSFDGGASVLDYRLHRRQGRWRIYDVLLNGHSFVASCRADFDQAIRSASYTALVRDMPRRDRAGFVGAGQTPTMAVS
jgi:phospholipid transport system substrate-binding protein